MSKKAYSEQEREQIKHDLLVTGLELFSQHGLRNVRLIDIIQGVGISKPFFYTFYTSMEELVIRILDYQQAMLFQLVEAELAREDIGWEEKVYNFFCKILYSRSNHLLVMTQEEEVWVFRRLSPEHYDAFQKGQEAFYAKLLSLWGVPEGRCDPRCSATCASPWC